MNYKEVFSWLCANKLSLNIGKSNYVIFRPPQKSVNYSINLKMNNQTLMYENSIKYLGIMIDSHLNWKSQVYAISQRKLKEILKSYLKFITMSILKLLQTFITLLYIRF